MFRVFVLSRFRDLLAGARKRWCVHRTALASLTDGPFRSLPRSYNASNARMRANPFHQIPQLATFEIRDKRYVFVVGKDNAVHREIVIPHEQNDSFIITKGVAVGDQPELADRYEPNHGSAASRASDFRRDLQRPTG